jgi:hypothetical protein
MFITLSLLGTSLLVLGVLQVERMLNGMLYTDNALDRARTALDDWRWTRHVRAQAAARLLAARPQAAE